VTFKWTVWQRFLHMELACYLLWLLSFQFFVLIFQASSPLAACRRGAAAGQAGVACSAATTARRRLALTGVCPPRSLRATARAQTWRMCACRPAPRESRPCAHRAARAPGREYRRDARGAGAHAVGRGRAGVRGARARWHGAVPVHRGGHAARVWPARLDQRLECHGRHRVRRPGAARPPPAQRACRLRAGARRAACIRRPGRGADGMPAACVCQPGCRPAVRAPDPPCVRRARASDARARAPQIAITVMHLGRLGLASNTLSVLVAFQVLLLWVKAQYFARQAPTPLFSPVSGTGAGSSGTHVCVCPVATHDTVQQVVRSLAPAAEVPDVLALMQAASLLCPAGRRALQPAKNPFLDTLKTVVVDIRFFLFLLLLTVWGFACAFYILFRRDQSKHVRPASITSTTLLSALPRHCEPAGCEAARLNARPPHACKSVLPTCARSLLCCASVPPVLRGAASCAGGLVALQRRDACHRGWRRTRSPILV